MFEYYIVDIFTGEEAIIEGYDFEEACFTYGIDPDCVEIVNEEYIG